MLRQESVTQLDAHTTSIEYSGTPISLLPGISPAEVFAIYENAALLQKAFAAASAIGEPAAPDAEPPPTAAEVSKAYEELLALKAKYEPSQP